MVQCSWKEEWGIDCLTCGFQRSFVALLDGNLLESISLFPATIPLLFTAFYTVLYLWKRFKNGHKVVIASYSLSALLIVVNYTVKLIDGSAYH